MLVRLWALAWVARYLRYVPVLGWRFSDSIMQTIESRMDRSIDVGDVSVDFEESAPPTDLHLEIPIANELPVDLTIAAVNLRVGYAATSKTTVNVLWSTDAHGTAPANITHSLVEAGGDETLSVEHCLPERAPTDTLHVDGTLTVRAWLDVPATKRIPLGTLERDIPPTAVSIPT